MNKFSELNIQPEFPLFGTKESINNVIGKPIILKNFKFLKVEQNDVVWDSSEIQFMYEGEETVRITFTRSNVVRKQLQQINKDALPVRTTFKQKLCGNSKKTTYLE